MNKLIRTTQKTLFLTAVALTITPNPLAASLTPVIMAILLEIILHLSVAYTNWLERRRRLPRRGDTLVVYSTPTAQVSRGKVYEILGASWIKNYSSEGDMVLELFCDGYKSFYRVGAVSGKRLEKVAPNRWKIHVNTRG